MQIYIASVSQIAPKVDQVFVDVSSTTQGLDPYQCGHSSSVRLEMASNVITLPQKVFVVKNYYQITDMFEVRLLFNRRYSMNLDEKVLEVVRIKLEHN